jgi:hypothetical protein
VTNDEANRQELRFLAVKAKMLDPDLSFNFMPDSMTPEEIRENLPQVRRAVGWLEFHINQQLVTD